MAFAAGFCGRELDAETSNLALQVSDVGQSPDRRHGLERTLDTFLRGGGSWIVLRRDFPVPLELLPYWPDERVRLALRATPPTTGGEAELLHDLDRIASATGRELLDLLIIGPPGFEPSISLLQRLVGTGRVGSIGVSLNGNVLPDPGAYLKRLRALAPTSFLVANLDLLNPSRGKIIELAATSSLPVLSDLTSTMHYHSADFWKVMHQTTRFGFVDANGGFFDVQAPPSYHVVRGGYFRWRSLEA